MDRRVFVKLGSIVIAGVAVGCKLNSDKEQSIGYKITIDSNRSVGHMAREAVNKTIDTEKATDVLVVGGGIAGLAAACSLKGRETIVCDLGAQFGGNSSAIDIGNQRFSQGAHYDNSYPGNYGEEGLQLLSDLDIIHYNNMLNRWDFNDKQFIIKSDREERCFNNGVMQSSVLLGSELKTNFLSLIEPYAGKMPLPTSLLAPRELALDHLTFSEYLHKYLPVTSNFMEAVDYQMMDDYGGTSSQVSALAGIHYYACRPYYTLPEPEVFSPTEGNYYFIRKMMDSLREEQLQNNSLVIGLQKSKQGWAVDVWDIANERKVRYNCKNVVYSGQKHLLKYLQKDLYPTFNDVKYAPWVVLNIELERDAIDSNIWQNDYLSSNAQFLGFVNSGAQTKEGNRVLTAYYCYPNIYHHIVQEIENDASKIVAQTIEMMSIYFEIELAPFVKHVYVKLLGHAMPIPVPGYLSKDRKLSQDGLAFAGSDSGRLPLMFDALDSGIQAANMI